MPLTKREYLAAIADAYKPTPATLKELLDETRHWIECWCGIRHGSPKCDSTLFGEQQLEAEYNACKAKISQ